MEIELIEEEKEEKPKGKFKIEPIEVEPEKPSLWEQTKETVKKVVSPFLRTVEPEEWGEEPQRELLPRESITPTEEPKGEFPIGRQVPAPIRPPTPPSKPEGPLGRASRSLTPIQDLPLAVSHIPSTAVTGVPTVQPIDTAPVIAPLKEREYAPELYGEYGAIREFLPKRAGLTQEQRNRAANIMGMAKELNLPPSFVEQHYDDFTQKLGMRGIPTRNEMVQLLMAAAITQGLVTAPIATVMGLGTYLGVKEAESLATQVGKGEKPKLLQGRELMEFLGPLEEPQKSIVEALEVLVPGLIGAKVMGVARERLTRKLRNKLIDDAWDRYVEEESKKKLLTYVEERPPTEVPKPPELAEPFTLREPTVPEEKAPVLAGRRELTAIEGRPTPREITRPAPAGALPPGGRFVMEEPPTRTILRPGPEPRRKMVLMTPEGEPVYRRGEKPVLEPLPVEERKALKIEPVEVEEPKPAKRAVPIPKTKKEIELDKEIEEREKRAEALRPKEEEEVAVPPTAQHLELMPEEYPEIDKVAVMQDGKVYTDSVHGEIIANEGLDAEKSIPGYTTVYGEFVPKYPEDKPKIEAQKAGKEIPATKPLAEKEPRPEGKPEHLRPAITHKGETIPGEVGETHPDIIERQGLEPDEPNRGFVTPEGKALTRKEAVKWMETNQPKIYDRWREIVGPDATELYSEHYREAAGLKEPEKEVLHAVETREIETRGIGEYPRVSEGGLPERPRTGGRYRVLEGREVPKEEEKVKEPWEMTLKEWAESRAQSLRIHPELLEPHKRSVQEALSEGKPVPEEVLKDYPDLLKEKFKRGEYIPPETLKEHPELGGVFMKPTTDWSLGSSRPFAFDPNSTTNEGRFRLYPPEDIKAGTYKSQTSVKSRGIPETLGIRYLVAETKDGKRVIQTIRFDMSIMPEEKAKEWWQANKGKFEFAGEVKKFETKPPETFREFVESKGIDWKTFDAKHPDYVSIKAAYDERQGKIEKPLKEETISKAEEEHEEIAKRELTEEKSSFMIKKEDKDVTTSKSEEWSDTLRRKFDIGRSEVETILKERFGERINPKDIRIPTELSNDQIKAIAKGERYGFEIVFFDGVESVVGISGITDKAHLGRIYINTNEPDVDVVLHHEIMHSQALTYPDEYNDLKDIIRGSFKDYDKFEKLITDSYRKVGLEISEIDIEDEFVSNLLTGTGYEYIKNPERVKREIDKFIGKTGIKGLLKDQSGFVSVDLLTPGLETAKNMHQGIASLLLPTAKSAEHLRAAEVLGSKLGSKNRSSEGVHKAFRKDWLAFEKMGVSNPNISLAQNPGIQFASDMSQGRPQPTPELRSLAERITNVNKTKLERLEKAGAPLEKVRENYFPGMWTKQSREAFNQAIGEAFDQGIGEGDLSDWTPEQKKWVADRVDEIIKEGGGIEGDHGLAYLAKRPFKGKESFRKEKVFDDVMTGVDFGLKPISNNPIDLMELKWEEIDRSIMANEAIQEWKGKGDIKFLRSGQELPEGWSHINDKYGTVWGPPEMLTKEYVDRNVWDALSKVCDNLGIKHERKPSVGRGKLGFAQGERIVTQAATELGVMAHEVGHELDRKYDLWDRIVTRAEGLGKKGLPTKTASRLARAKIQNELRAIADLKWEGQAPTEYEKKYVRKKAEKVAQVVEAYVQMPERFMSVAPHVWDVFDRFVNEYPELEPLRDIQSGISYKELVGKRHIAGFPIVGHWIAKQPVADIINNYLSSSLYNSPYFGAAYKAYMNTANLLNQFQLGMGSAFHAGFTSGDVQTSAVANLYKDIYGVLIARNRKFSDLVTTAKKLPTAIVSTSWEGAKVLKEWETPTMEIQTNIPINQLPNTNEARIAMVTKAVELAGGGFKLEHGLRTEVTDAMVRSWYGGEKAKAVAQSPFTFVELSCWPIMEFLVPRQKAGVFADLAGRLIEQNPDKTLEQLRPQFRQAWNRVDGRLGQVRYQRTFVNNVAKNVAQALIRAPGWTGGTLIELGGAFKDAGKFFYEWAKDKKPPKDIPDRVAYALGLLTFTAVANGLLTLAFTGDNVNDLQPMDFIAFRDGGVDEHGRRSRLLLPTYMKDVWAWFKHPGKTLLNKTHPLISLLGDILRNKDYYGVKIYNEDDNFLLKAIDANKYVLKQFIPFWVRGSTKIAERGGGIGEMIGPEFGIMPAPTEYTQTPFEEYASKVATGKMPAGSRTREQFERSQEKRKLEMELRRKEPTAKVDIREARREKKITTKEEAEIRRRAKMSLTEKAAQHMTVDELARGWLRANEEERRILKPIFKKRIAKAFEDGRIDRDTRRRYLNMTKE